jgi:hypothetical protein
MSNEHVREHDPFSGHADPADPVWENLPAVLVKLEATTTVFPQEIAVTPLPAEPPPAAREPEVKKAPVRRGRKPRRTVSKPAAK